MAEEQALQQILEQFDCPGSVEECIPYGQGHINNTYRIVCRKDGKAKYYILQSINGNVFKEPEKVMENIENVTAWLKKKIRENGGDEKRETLILVRTKDGGSCYFDSDKTCWRMYYFIRDAVSFEQVKSAEDFYQSAVAFGHFQRLLADYPADTLHETIADFHNTQDRFRKFKEVLERDPCGRAADAAEEIQFVLEREELAGALCRLQAEGKLPLRVTHNDTKLNNVMFDRETGAPICIVDLDTVMPGLSVNDFGDSIRFGASTAAEDEKDLSKVSCDLELYEAYVKGFIEGCEGALTEAELDNLPLGAVMMTFECGMRFLTDHLDGDHYFKIHREGHNLDRCRTQFKLVKDMEGKMEQMKAIVDRYR